MFDTFDKTSTDLDPIFGSAPGFPIVLYFHHVLPNANHYTALTPESFTRAIGTITQYLQPVAARNVLLLNGVAALPDHPSVLITIDDGYADQIEFALPILETFGLKAIFFVNTSLLGRRTTGGRQMYMSAEDCRELNRRGHIIAPHGRTHADLTQHSVVERTDQIVGSFRELVLSVGLATDDVIPCFAFPYGRVVEIPRPVQEACGEMHAFGTVKSPPASWTTKPHAIRRTYLPTGREECWSLMTRKWVQGWFG